MSVKVNLGCGDALIDGYVNVDRTAWLAGVLVADLDEDWPWQDSTVAELRAFDVIEHLAKPIHTMNEAWRVLEPEGLFHVLVPTTDGRGAFQDPTHVSFWNRNSFFYYTHLDPHRERFGDAYGIRARFRVEREKSHVYRQADGGVITHVEIWLRAVKEPVR